VAPNEGVDPTEGLTPSRCGSTPTATGEQGSVRGGHGDSTEQTDSEDSDLSANRFGLDVADDVVEAASGDDELAELLAEVSDDDRVDELLAEVSDGDRADELLAELAAESDYLDELVARQWGTPRGEWWP